MVKRPMPKTLSAWFVLAAGIMAIVGLWTSTSLGDSAMDLSIHDTYFVIANHHLVLASAFLCLLCAFIYWGFQKWTKHRINGTLGLIHLGMTAIGLIGIITPLHLMTSVSAPRRYYEYSAVVPTDGYSWMADANSTVSGSAIVCLIGQIVLLANIILTLARRPAA